MSQAVKRATEIIELIADSPRSLSDLAKQFEVDRSTIFRQLQTLEQAGFVLRHSDGKYNVGTRIISIAQQALDNLDLRRIAHDEISALQSRVGNTLHLAQLIENQVVYIDKVEGSDSVRMYSRVGLPVLPNATAVGKVILAQLSVDKRDALLRDADWTVHTATTHATRESLDIELKQIADEGWGVDDGEFEDFVNCVAAPVSNSTGTIVGALSISSIRMVNTLDDLTAHLGDLLATTRTISLQLG